MAAAPFRLPSRQDRRPIYYVRCQLCAFRVPLEDEDAIRTHFDREHLLAAPDLKRFVELCSQLPVAFQVTVPRVGSTFKITLPQALARSVHLAKSDRVGLTLLDGEIRLCRLKG